MLYMVEDLERHGHSLQHFCRELARYWRNLLVARIAGKPSRLIAASENEQKGLLETAHPFSEEDLTRYLNLTLDLYKTMQSSLQPRLHLELGLVKLVQAGKLQSIEEALAGLSKAENPTNSSPTAGGSMLTASAKSPAPPRPAFQAPTVAKPAADKLVERPIAVDKQPVVEAAIATGDLRQDLYEALCKAGMEHSADAVQHAEVRMEGCDVILRAPKAMMLLLKDPGVERVASQVIGKTVRVRLEAGEVMNTVPLAGPQRPTSPDNALRERALSHPSVKRFQELFPGAQVRTVRNLNE
jgi:DNA polymerase-3 subunit gamma/tau